MDIWNQKVKLIKKQQQKHFPIVKKKEAKTKVLFKPATGHNNYKETVV